MRQAILTTEKAMDTEQGWHRGDEAMLYALGAKGQRDDMSTCKGGQQEGKSASSSPMPTRCSSKKAHQRTLLTSPLAQSHCIWALSVSSVQYWERVNTDALRGTLTKSSLQTSIPIRKHEVNMF